MVSQWDAMVAWHKAALNYTAIAMREVCSPGSCFKIFLYWFGAPVIRAAVARSSWS